VSNVEEKRQNPRLDIFLSVTYDDPEAFLADYVFNASEGGVFIATNKSFAVGDEIKFQVSFPGLLKPFLCHGRVCWQKKQADAESGEPAGIGVAFLPESIEESQRIKDLIERFASPVLPTTHQAPYNILLVEDDIEVRDTYHSALNVYNNLEFGKCRAIVIQDADDGVEAWEMIKAEVADGCIDLVFDMVIVKIEPAHLKGQELIKLIREHESIGALPIIATGQDTAENKATAHNVGADMFLHQPIVLTTFFHSLQRFLFI
jgi:Response regulators consisting of a CheY-like receiver domain and a winged-helix DNA-binding domain